jgi:hypothetical protein
MGVVARAGWEALASQLRGALARRALRRIALAQPGVTAAEVAQDDESATLRLAVHLHVAVGCEAAAVAAQTLEAIRRRLPFGEIVVRVVGVAR